MTLRLGYLTYGLDRAPTGIGRYAVELLQALAALPGAPEIVLLTTERDDPFALWDRFERHTLLGCRLLPALLTVGNAALSAASRYWRLDLVHDPNGIAPFLGPRAGVARVVTIHDAFPYVHPDTHTILDNWRYRSLLLVAARRADAVVTDSNCSRLDLLRHLHLAPNRVHVTPAGVNPRFSHVADNPARQETLRRYDIRPPYILYLGGITARKNIARLLEAFAQLRQQLRQVTLVLVGKRQWHADEVAATFERLNLGESVRWTGYVDERDLPGIYSAAELFVFPSLYEGFGLPPLEAMACGTPVVTSNISSLPEVVGEAALTVDPYDVAGLAAAMERALLDEGLRVELRRRGIERAAQFTWGRAARETLAVYRQVLGMTDVESLSSQRGRV